MVQHPSTSGRPLTDQLVPPEGDTQSLAGQLGQLSTGTPVEEFLVELIAVGDELGVLDDAFAPSELEGDLLSGEAAADRGQMTRLAAKFAVIPPEQQTQIMSALQQEMDPESFSRLQAIARLGGQT